MYKKYKCLNVIILILMELYQPGPDSYLIQIFKWTLESWEFIVGNSLFHAVFTTPAGFFFELGLSRGSNLN